MEIVEYCSKDQLCVSIKIWDLFQSRHILFFISDLKHKHEERDGLLQHLWA